MKKVNDKTANKAADDYKAAKIELDFLKAKYDEEIAPIHMKYADAKAVCDAKMAKCEATIATYVENNRETILEKAKSATFRGLKVGFRKATASLKINVEGRDWKEVLALAKKHLPDYVVSKETLDKSNLVKAADGLQKELKKLGVEVSQEEKFFVKVS